MIQNEPYKLHRSAHVDADDIGGFFVDKDGLLWKMVGYVAEPQAIFQCVDDAVARTHGESRVGEFGEIVEHVVGCPNHHEMGLRRLKPEGES